MARIEKNQGCNSSLGFCSESTEEYTHVKKPLEVYTFIDPLCPECWAFEPTLKKLQVEYGSYFQLRYIIAGKLDAWNKSHFHFDPKSIENVADVWEKTASRTGMSCDGELWFEHSISSPYTVAVAIKAAEMQGRQAGMRYLRRLQEVLFLDKQNITKENILLRCAKEVGLDVSEFQQDLHSESAVKALQYDIKTTKEMNVEKMPTFVFFNDQIDEEGVMVTGDYPYEIYVHIISHLLGRTPEPSQAVSIEAFLAHYRFVATKEVAVVFNISIQEAERQLKKLKLKQVVDEVPVKYGTFWRYISEEKE